MWNRKELKKTGKARFKANYWRCFLVGLILMFITGGFNNSGIRFTNKGDAANPAAGGKIIEFSSPNEQLNEAVSEISDEINLSSGSAVAAFIGIVAIVLILVLGIALCLEAFLLGPIEVSCRKFFVDNLKEQGMLSALGRGFDVNYLNVVKTMFLLTIRLILWTLLLIVPGIIKGYEYRMVPYLMAEDPNMSGKEAFAKSKEMMHGNKWDTFVLDLSFIGWEFLGVITLGLLKAVYVKPYEEQTFAALYETLRSENQPQEAAGEYYVEVK